MLHARLGLLLVAALFATEFDVVRAAAEDFPAPEALPSKPGLPDPLTMLDGTKVGSRAQWEQKRRPELKRLFQHYMYGFAPPAPDRVTAKVEYTNAKALGGKATMQVVTLKFGPDAAPPIHLLIFVPNGKEAKSPAFLGITFCGNHSLLEDANIPLAEGWIYPSCPECKEGRATDASRGKQADVWAVEQTIDRGYALATFYSGDVDPDHPKQPDFADGIHPHYRKPGQTTPAADDWGTIAAWAWGVSRAVDYLVTRPDIDAKRIATVGHSRLGKTVLLAAALDERIALTIPHQAGCGGTAPSRGTVGESVKRINTAFPHWFNDVFPQFNDDPSKLPFDQNCLVALCAPRPVLLSNAAEDQWANPDGQFEVLQGADSTYRFLGVEGLKPGAKPESERLIDSRLGYYIRPGKHSMTTGDWKVFLDFADRHLKLSAQR
jgi:hypothetical protein